LQWINLVDLRHAEFKLSRAFGHVGIQFRQINAKKPGGTHLGDFPQHDKVDFIEQSAEQQKR
jgi:hypothetical protein